MLKENILDSLYAKRTSPAEFNFEALQAPSMYNFLSDYELGKIYDITTSLEYSSKVDMKIKAIKDILLPRGFVQFANGTNRMCFRYLEDKTFVLKVAYKKSGLDNGIKEYRNQQYLKPFVAKTFEVHPSGIASTHERVLPITNREEFLSVADDVFDLLTALMGKWVLDDVGSKYFMNLGIRPNFGVVLIDYVDLYELDGRKLFCNRPIIPNTKWPLCGGLLDLDDGFNSFVCTKCGKEYSASDLRKARENKDVILEGDINMKVILRRNGETVAVSDDVTDIIVKPTEKKKEKRSTELKVNLVRHTENIKKEEEPVEEEASVNIGEFNEEEKKPEPNTPKPNRAKIDIKFGKDKPASDTIKKAATIAANTTNMMVDETRRAQIDLIKDYADRYNLDDNDLALIEQVLKNQGHNYTLMDLTENMMDRLFAQMASRKAIVDQKFEEDKKAEQSKPLTSQKQEDKESVSKMDSKFIPTSSSDIGNY